MGRKRGRAATSKRTKSKRQDAKERLVKEIGIDEFKKILQSDKREKEGTTAKVYVQQTTLPWYRHAPLGIVEIQNILVYADSPKPPNPFTIGLLL